jgi:hypothetical protein
MVKVKIDNVWYSIKKFSELTVAEYSAIMLSNSHSNLLTYIEAFTGKQINTKEVQCNYKFEDMENIIFDCTEDFTKITPDETITVNEIVYLKSELLDNSFGAKYLIDLYRRNYNAGKFTLLQYYVAVLAIMISRKNSDLGSFDDSKIDEVYKLLLNDNWRKVLPLSFFLLMNMKTKKSFLMLRFMKLTLGFQLSLKVLKLHRLKSRTT